MIRKLAIAILVLFGVWLAQAGVLPKGGAEAAPASGLGIAGFQCTADGKVGAHVSWRPSGQGFQWIDASFFNNNFAANFTGWGAFQPSQNAATWWGLDQNTVIYMRINTLTGFGWEPSATISFRTPSCQQTQPAARNLNVLTQSCIGGGYVSVTFGWQPSGAGWQWVDLTSLNTNFAPGTYAPWGALSPGDNALTWPGLFAQTTYYVRVNTLTASGWFASQTFVFTTMACQSNLAATGLLLDSQVCTNGGAYVSATFEWNPSGAGNQWVDITTLNQNFAPGTYAPWGPLAPSQDDLTWPGLTPGATYYVRVSTLTAFGWYPSQTLSFLANACLQFSTGQWTVDGDAVPTAPALLTGVAAAAHNDDDFDRIVFQFAGALPDATIQYVDSVSECGSGDPVELEGDFIIRIRMTPAEAHTGAGPTVVTPVEGTGVEILEAKQVCDFEGVVTWAIGVKLRKAMRVTTLPGPNRIVIDVLQ